MMRSYTVVNSLVIFIACHLIADTSCFTIAPSKPARLSKNPSTQISMSNMYDEWSSSGLVDTTYLSEDTILECLDDFVDSDYGQTMFGCHDAPASIGVTGDISFVELAGPQVVLRLEGAFWHRRATVLGRAAVWLNARMPEVTDVTVEDREELADFEEIRDEFSGDVIAREDKRAPDFNGDRATMEYQGLDPDERGPFPPSIFGSSRLTINPM